MRLEISLVFLLALNGFMFFGDWCASASLLGSFFITVLFLNYLISIEIGLGNLVCFSSRSHFAIEGIVIAKALEFTSGSPFRLIGITETAVGYLY